MKPQFVGLGRPQVALRRISWRSPTNFTPGSPHTARVGLLNPTDRVWAYRGEVYLDGRVASSGTIEFTMEAGAERAIDFPVIMPEAGSYQAFLDVSVGEELLLHHPFPEPVTVEGAPPGPPPAEGWTCGLCGAPFNTWEELDDHYRTAHAPPSPPMDLWVNRPYQAPQTVDEVVWDIQFTPEFDARARAAGTHWRYVQMAIIGQIVWMEDDNQRVDAWFEAVRRGKVAALYPGETAEQYIRRHDTPERRAYLANSLRNQRMTYLAWAPGEIKEQYGR